MSLLARAATPLLGPILLWQGRRTRIRVARLPEADGPREGVTGEGEPLRLLVIGDSSGAGVGASTQDESLLGRTVAALARDRRVEWRLVAKSGRRTGQALAALRELPDDVGFDVAVTALGVNDATAGTGLPQWLGLQRELRERLRHRGVRRMVVSGLPPVSGFPALPQPLRWWLGAKARAMSAALEAEVAGELDVRFVALDFTRDASKMAPDGFHPGPEIYAEWGRRAAEALDGTV